MLQTHIYYKNQQGGNVLVNKKVHSLLITATMKKYIINTHVILFVNYITF